MFAQSWGVMALVHMFTRFYACRQGAVAVLFAVLSVPAFLVLAMGVDYYTHTATMAKMQNIVDAAVLSAARTAANPTEAVPTTAQRQAFEAEITAKLAGTPVFTLSQATLVVDAGGAFTGRIKGTSKLWFGGFIGKSTTAVDVTASVSLAGMDVEIAMGIDVSGSMLGNDMSGTRIAAAQTAAKQLIDTVTTSASATASFKFALVPFAFTTNIGTANTAYVTGLGDPLLTGTSWAGCVFERSAPEHISNDYNGSVGSSKGQWNAYVAPPEPNAPAGACANPSNGTNDGYETIAPYVAGNPFPGTRGPNFNCVRHAMKPLSTSAIDVKTAIDGLTAEYNNGTVFSLGITWGLRMLTPDAPFPGAAAFGPKTKKIIIALTDGAQTTEAVYQTYQNSCPLAVNSGVAFSFDPKKKKMGGAALTTGPRDNISPYGYIFDSDPFGYTYGSMADVDTSLDRLTLEACDYAKKFQNVEIYTIAVSSFAGPGTSVYNTLNACATDPKHFFWVTDVTGMNAAFNSIAKNVKSLALTR